VTIPRYQAIMEANERRRL